MYDIAIVGAGPAGATLARLVGATKRVLVVDRRDLRGERGPRQRPGKCCGGLLAPDAQKYLVRFGMGLPKNVLTGPQLFAVRTIDLEGGLERFYQRHYINMDRELFDRWLVSRIPAWVEMRCPCSVRGIAAQSDRVALQLDGGEQADCRLLVGADGAASVVRRAVRGTDTGVRTYLAIQEWREARDPSPWYSAIFDPTITDYFSWTIPKGDLLLVGSALPMGDGPHQRFEALKQKLRAYGFDWGGRVCREGARIARPRGVGELLFGAGNIVLIGEAAGLISPSSGEGFSFAFASAELLARALQPGIKGVLERYRHSAGSLCWRVRRKLLKSPFMYNAVLRRLVMASGLRAVEVNLET